MNSLALGTPTSAVEISHISAHGIWIIAGEKECFMDYEHFPWFKNASIGQILNVTEPSPMHFYWPDLDIDLGLDTILYPERFPLVGS